MLEDMTQGLIEKLPALDSPHPDIRNDVYKMFSDYIQGALCRRFHHRMLTVLEGQHVILQGVSRYAKERQQEAIAMAKAEGVDIVIEDDDDDAC